jgi:phosphopantetheine adenylyltransferase
MASKLVVLTQHTDPTVVEHIVQHSSDEDRLYIYLADATDPPTLQAVQSYLRHIFPSSLIDHPMLQITPLIPYLGWSLHKTASILDLHHLIVAHPCTSTDIQQQLSAARTDQGLSPFQSLEQIEHQHQQGENDMTDIKTHNDDNKASSLIDTHYATLRLLLPDGKTPCTATDRALQWDTVAVGGTFDHFHAGHRLLSATTAIVARRRIFCGVTADKLLAKKQYAELLESYEIREAAATDYMRAVNPQPGLSIRTGPLTDPDEPPLAATDPDFQAIVVSEETVAGAEQINQVRRGLGFEPLEILVVGLLKAQTADGKLSSTHIRQILHDDGKK